MRAHATNGRGSTRTQCVFTPCRGQTGFTLVELLVVIGIIALLIALLLPALGRARESANQVVCLSNLRQLGMSFVMYANQNQGRFPGASPQTSGTAQMRPWDWIYWQSGRDPKDSAIVPYIGDFQERVFRCPSDDVSNRGRDLGPKSGGFYRYSYVMNAYFSEYVNPADAEFKIAAVRRASEKVMLVEESNYTLDDGNFDAGTPYPYHNLLSTRHDRGPMTSDAVNIQIPNPEFRGNAVMVDGHGEFVRRSWAHDPMHYKPKL